MPSEAQVEKACSVCRTVKPLIEYGRDKRHSDGRTSECKACILARNKKYRKEPRVAAKAAAFSRDYYARNTEQERERRAAYRKAHNEPSAHDRSPFKEAARRLLRGAIRRGEVVKPANCEDCGNPSDVIHGHHEDYSKPLSVDWLCVACHGARHRKYPDPEPVRSALEGA